MFQDTNYNVHIFGSDETDGGRAAWGGGFDKTPHLWCMTLKGAHSWLSILTDSPLPPPSVIWVTLTTWCPRSPARDECPPDPIPWLWLPAGLTLLLTAPRYVGETGKKHCLMIKVMFWRCKNTEFGLFPREIAAGKGMEAEEGASRVSRLHSQLLGKLPEEKEPSLEAIHFSFCHLSFLYLVYIMLAWTPNLPDLLEKEVILQITVTDSLQRTEELGGKTIINMMIQPSFTILLSTQCLCSCQVWKSSSSPCPEGVSTGPRSGKGTLGCSARGAVELVSLSHP